MTTPEYSNPKEDKWFEWKGVKPPERNAHLTEDDIEALLANNLAKHKCDFHQNGAYAVCDIDSFEHGKKIPAGMLLDKEKTDEKGVPVYRPFGAVLRTETEHA